MPNVLTTPAAEPDDARCAGCAQPTSASGVDGYWVLAHRRWHAACAPWHAHAFPFGWALERGELALRRAGTGRAVYGTKLPRAVVFLARLRDGWPPEEPADALRKAALAARVITRWDALLRRR